MYEPQPNKKVAVLAFLIFFVISTIAGYFITQWAFFSEDESGKAEKTVVKEEKPKEEKKADTEDTFGIEVTDPTKASEDITDERTLEFIKDLSKHDPNYPTAYGDPNAPVTVIEFSDFSCPMCAKFHKESYELIDKLVDAGKVRVKYMPYAVFKADGSDIAAAGAIAAGKQGKFREYVHLAFSKATTSGHQQYTKESVVALGKEAGVPNMDEFTQALNDSAIYDELNDNVLKFSSWGISGTPSTIVGNAFLHGALPTEYVAATLVDQVRKATK